MFFLTLYSDQNFISQVAHSNPSLKVSFTKRNCQTVSNCIIFSLSLSLSYLMSKQNSWHRSCFTSWSVSVLWLGYKILLRQVSYELCSIVYSRRILLTGNKAKNFINLQEKISVKTKDISIYVYSFQTSWL